MTDRRKLIIDTDPGIDDAVAVLMALACDEFDLIGLTTVFGNAAVDATTRNAHAILHAARRSDLPIVRGASTPLAGTYAGPVPHIHGTDGLGDGGVARPAISRDDPGPAAMFLCEQINRSPGDVHILALGPLTNLALALRLDPSLSGKVASVTLMGGNAFCAGNATPCAEANFLGDPEAGDIVLGAVWPVAMIGLDVTQKIVLDADALSEITCGSSAVASLLRAVIPCYRRFFGATNGIDGLLCHDPSAVAFLIRPDLFEKKSWPMRVETQGISRGKTWPDVGATDRPAKAWQDRRPVSVAVGADYPTISRVIVERLRRLL